MNELTPNSYEEFRKLAEEGTAVPVMRRVMADLLAPVAAYLKIQRHSPYSFLLESVEGGEKVARYSFLGFNPETIVRRRAGRVSIDPAQLEDPIDPLPRNPATSDKKFRSNMNKEQFEQAVLRAKEYIKAGDIFQVVLSQRFHVSLSAHPFEVYRALRVVNPSPYMVYLKLNDRAVIAASPEMLVRATGRRLEYRPIAGTARRGATETEDLLFGEEMRADEKEVAEHVMLVDRGRNDLGRVADYGSVEVTDLMIVERYSHVMHLVSGIKARLRAGKDRFDALAACFPAGTVTGAPKVRSMEIIEELEPTRRGVYAGAVMYLDHSGNLDSCIAIRTIFAKDGRASIQAAAGIVADSVPESEYVETVNKARAMLQAIEMAEQE